MTFARLTGIEVASTIRIDGGPLDERTSINAFRILQESLTNVTRHADCDSSPCAPLVASDECLALEIRDNGRGRAVGAKIRTGPWLVGIRERTLMFGGRMEISSAPGQGFSICIRIPLDAQDPAGDTK